MDNPEPPVSRRRHVAALAVVAGLVLVAYSNCFSAGLARDDGLVLRDTRVHALTRQHVEEIFSHGYLWPSFPSGLYRPVATFSYLVNFALLRDGMHPAAYHWINCLLHVANAFLVYLLMLTLGRRFWPALGAAALWALHPVSTDAVTNIAGRPEGLADFGLLASLLLYIRSGKDFGWGRRAGMLAAATVAVFSKESGVMVLALAALYDFTFRTGPGHRVRDWLAAFPRRLQEGYVYLLVPVCW